LQATERWEGTFPGCSSTPGRDGTIAGLTSWTATSVGARCPSPVEGCDDGANGPEPPLPDN
jgi:hypothetical protein